MRRFLGETVPRLTNPLPQLIPQRLGNLLKRIDPLLWSSSQPLAVRGGPINDEPVPLAEGMRQRLAKVQPGDFFGPSKGDWKQRWFRIDLPAASAAERGHRHLFFECQGEGTAYLDGQPWAGFDPAHRSQLAPDRACTLWVDLGTYQTGIWLPGLDRLGVHGLRFDGCRLAVRDQQAWDAYWDVDAFVQAVNLLLKKEGLKGSGTAVGFMPPPLTCSPLARQLLRALDEAIDTFDASGDDLAVLRRALAAVARRFPAEYWQPLASLCGHAHLDLVWLWPEREAERKGVHTFATQLRLMERYPEFIFVQSQPALYRAIQRRAPGIYRQIQARIKERRWEAMGGFETEPDTLLPAGEALARALVHGQDKLAELNGAPSRLCWIPDVFGYANCLPQILRLGGVDRFYTTKMTWSAVTRFPYNSFVWRGADGSEVLAYLCSTGFNGNVELENMDDAVRGHRQADVHTELLLPTGYGDGGGGTTEAQLERARRFRNLATAPRTRWSRAGDAFDRLEAVRDRLPVYQGELYLEYHRGTYTTQSEFKRLYRAAERALQEHEAVRVVRGGKPIAAQSWQRVAFAQFHDAIPGSSIGLVYEQMNPELDAIASEHRVAATAELTGKADGHLVFNPLPVPRSVVVELPAARSWRDADGAALPVQSVGEGRRKRSLVAVDLPALGSRRLLPGNVAAVVEGMHATPRRLDNGRVAADFDAAGRLVRLSVDGAPLALSGPARFVLYHDRPANFDAWDIDHYVLKGGVAVAEPLELTVVESGPVRAVLRGSAAIGAASRMTVDWILEAGSRFLKVEAAVDWREDHQLLKFHVPTAYRGRCARFGAPFGSIERPQLPGIQSDEAMWEVPGSRWAAVSDDDGGGLALCSEAKYGFSCRDGDLGLSLLRSPKDPDERADRGSHRLRFAVGAHRDTSDASGLATAAATDELYAAPVVAAGGRALVAPFTLDHLGSLVPVWALPSPGGGFVLRLHEVAGARGSALIDLAATPKSVRLVDFLERPLGTPRRRSPRRYEIAYTPYQVVSVLVR